MLKNLSSTVTSIVLSFYPPANIALNLRTLVDILAQNQCITELLIRVIFISPKFSFLYKILQQKRRIRPWRS